MPDPVERAPSLDPLSVAVGRLEGRLDALERAVAEIRRDMATTAELRVWGTLLALLLTGVLARLLTR